MKEPTDKQIEAGATDLAEWLCDSPISERRQVMRDMALSVHSAMQAAAPAEAAEADMDAGRELLREAWHEFNAIRARDGAPIGVSHEYWSEMTDRLGELLGDDTKPWMLGAAKALLAPERARVSELEDEVRLVTAQADANDERARAAEAEAARLREALTYGAQVNLPDFLEWWAARAVDKYNENPQVDYVLSLRIRAQLCRAALADPPLTDDQVDDMVIEASKQRG